MAHSLPVIPSPAEDQKVRLVSARLPLDLYDTEGAELAFFLDGNSKITLGETSFGEPKVNAFSLPAAAVEWDGDPFRVAHVALPACPGSTSVCRGSCYVKGLQKNAPAHYAGYKENDRVLGMLLRQGEAWANYAADTLAKWIVENAPEGFRWHVSGDVQSVDHAGWIAEVCDRASQVPFWIYTRTLDAVGYLGTCTGNLTINVSADRENWERARRVAWDYGARLCYLSDDGTVPPELPEGSVIFPDYPLREREEWWNGLSHDQRVMVCPSDYFGHSEAHRCAPCKKCM